MKKISLLLLLVLAAVMSISCTKNDGGSLFGGAEKGNFLDTLKIDDFKVDFKVVQMDSIAKGNSLISKAAQGGTYIIVYCNATNVGIAPKRPIDITVKLQDPNNSEYMWDLGATTSFITTSEAITEKIISDINPGITVTTAYVFEVSQNLLKQKGWKLNFEMDKKNYLLDFVLKNKQPNKPAEMILVAGGTYKMSDYYGIIVKIVEVTLDSFYIGKYEVTNAEYNSLMAEYFINAINGNDVKADEKKTVANISWFQAVEFCNAKSAVEGLTPCYTIKGEEVSCNFKANGYRLPTEAEWEIAAWGGNLSKGFTYSGSNNIGEVAWYNENSGNATHNVGTKAPNELGIYDMSGNVWEWCWDWYDDSYSHSDKPLNNPLGAQSGKEKVYRGYSYEDNVYTSSRVSIYPNYKSKSLGFRLARSYKTGH